MARVQVNLKLDEKILEEVNKLVKKGLFDSKTEAFTRALQLLIQSHKAEELAKQIDRIREGTESAPSVTEVVVKAHEEENEL